MTFDEDTCWRAARSRDPRFDGMFVIAVVTTGIYCRPSCPARPRRANVRFFPTAAAAQRAGFRACKRCRPDAAPGSPEWNTRADLVGRAMRLIADGVVDREGVDGLAGRLGFSPRHVHRQLVAELGAGPQALARAARAQTARVLLETTDLPIAGVAFGSGFASVRQFNDTIRATFALTPRQLRDRGGRPRRTAAGAPAPGELVLRLAYRRPLAWPQLLGFLAARAVPGVEEAVGDGYRRSLSLPHGWAVVDLLPGDGHIRCVLRLHDVRDVAAAVQRCRRLLDLDADPAAIDASLSADPHLAGRVAALPGLRVPGHPDPAELAVRAVLGQQVSVAGARRTAGRLVAAHGKPLTAPVGGVTHLFPDAETLAGVDPAQLPVPAARGRTVQRLAAALAGGALQLDPGADRGETRRALLTVAGIGPWTADYILLRALGDPDVFLAGDLGVRRALGESDIRTIEGLAQRWRPWRSYALMHVWQGAGPTNPGGSAR